MPDRYPHEVRTSETQPPQQHETISAVVDQIPLRRDLTEPLPPTPDDLPIGRFPPTIAAVLSLLPAGLREKFRQELEQTHFQDLPKLVMEWGEAAISLHSDDIQRSLEALEDDDKEALKTLFIPLPN